MKQFFNKRLTALSNPKIKGDIISNIGVGFLVNSLYSVSLGGWNIMNFVDFFIAVFAIIEGSYLKENI